MFTKPSLYSYVLVPTSSALNKPLAVSALKPLSTIPTGKLTQTSTLSMLYKCLIAAELKEKREKGLCYYYNGKYSLNHKCPTKSFLLVGSEEVDDLLIERVETPEPPELGDNSNDAEVLGSKLNLHSLGSQINPHTLRVTGELSTHNFLKSSLVTTPQLKIEQIPPFKVLTGSGTYLLCNSICRSFTILLQGHKFVLDVHPVKMQGVDLAKGI